MASIKDRLVSDENIYFSIYLVDSYINNKELLSSDDRELLVQLKDIFNVEKITEVIEKIKNILEETIENDDKYFDTNVFFKPKKYDREVIFRPLHTATVINQIAMIAMLQILVYDIGENEKLIPSELSRLLPSNFYGNRVSFNGNQLFKPWQEQYQQYTTKANQMLYTYCETLEYKYEVSLDLENFFPSINPQILYNFFSERLPLKLDLEDQKTYKTILRKLLIFNLNELEGKEVDWYLGPEKQETSESSKKLSSSEATKEIEKLGKPVRLCSFTKGMPQGLPHTYFMANFFMLMIKEDYANKLPGEMLFYVDDSIIFTNGENGELNSENFKKIIEALNNSISKREQEMIDSNTKDLIFPLKYPYTDEDFGVKVHKMDGKSIFSDIYTAKENSGEKYLMGLSRETSNVGLDMFTIFSEEETGMVKNKVATVLNLINKEIDRILLDDKKKVYLKKLLRYKKFFSYRSTILEYKETGSIEELKDSLLKDINFSDSEEGFQKFFEKYSDDILSSTIEFVFRRCMEESVDTEDKEKAAGIKAPKNMNDIIDAVKSLDNRLYSGDSKHSYIAKAYEKYLNRMPEYYEVDIYKSLRTSVIQRYHPIPGQVSERKYAKFKNALYICQTEDQDVCTKENDSKLYNLLKLSDIYLYSKYVRASSDNLERMILNCIFSYLFEYEIDDKFTLAKKSRTLIEYSEVRILSVLRNRKFKMSDFLFRYEDYVKDDFRQIADYSLLQVLDIFKLFVSDADRIDYLILIHKYCCDTWKNGSKYLHFYTLHNQEHAVSLIKSSIKILHAISCFSIKKIDYFILFASCYLHDISMVTLPDTSKFYRGNNEKANGIYTDFINDLDTTDSTKTKKTLCDVYQNIDSYFEADIRDNHAHDSAMEIRSYHELDFLDAPVRELIAEASAGHGYDSEDIYFAKSDGDTALINKKLIKILLRLSDLLDMSRYRISKVILDHNLKNLNKVSRFHWISHLITNQYHLDTKYLLSENDSVNNQENDFENSSENDSQNNPENVLDNVSKNTSGNNSISNSKEGSKEKPEGNSEQKPEENSEEKSSYLKKGFITERLVLTVDVLMSQTTEVPIREKCKCIKKSNLEIDKDGKTKIILSCDDTEKCGNDRCNFLCKWFVAKNNYLFSELGALKRYLNNLMDNFYSFEVDVEVNVISNTNVPSETFDYLKDYLSTI